MKMVTLWLIDDCGDEEWTDIVNVTSASEMCQYLYLIIILLKSAFFQKYVRYLITAIWLFWTVSSFMTTIFAVILHD